MASLTAVAALLSVAPGAGATSAAARPVVSGPAAPPAAGPAASSPAASTTTTTAAPTTSSSTTAASTSAPPTSASPPASAPASSPTAAVQQATDVPMDAPSVAALQQANKLLSAAGDVQSLTVSLQTADMKVLQAGDALVALQTKLQQVTATRDTARTAAQQAGRRFTGAQRALRSYGIGVYVAGPPPSPLLDTAAHGTDNRSLTTRALERSVLDQLTDRYAATKKAKQAAAHTLAARQRAVDAAAKAVDGARKQRDQLAAQRDALASKLTGSRADVAGLRQQVNATALATLSGGSIGTLLAQRQADEVPPADPVRIFSWPLQTMQLTSPYGFRTYPLGGGTEFHPGADFGAPRGTPIHAAAAGIVVVASPQGGYGNCTVIDHGNGLATLYGHQSRQVVQVGDVVSTGQIIGYVGSTGASTGPHLHFEVRRRGQLTDPLPWLNPPVNT